MKPRISKNQKRALLHRRILQIIVAVGALVPVLAGLVGVLMGPGMVDNPDASSLSLDSHFRYMSGLLMAIGIGFWTTVPDIENKTVRFQLLSGIVILGGLGRLYALMTMGAPGAPMLFGLAMELIVTPALVVGQMAVARQSRR